MKAYVSAREKQQPGSRGRSRAGFESAFQDLKCTFTPNRRGPASQAASGRRDALTSPRFDQRFRRHAEAAWRLGPAPIACLFEEIATGADLRAAVARYAQCAADYGAFSADHRGDRFTEPMLLHLAGGRR